MFFLVLFHAIVAFFRAVAKFIHNLIYSNRKRMASRAFRRVKPFLFFAAVWFIVRVPLTQMWWALAGLDEFGIVDILLSPICSTPELTALLVTIVYAIVSWRRDLREASTTTDEEGNVVRDKTLAHMEALRIGAVALRVIGVALIVVGGIISPIAYFFNPVYALLASGIPIVGIVMIIVAHKRIKRSNDLFKNEFVIRELERTFDNLRYSRDEHFGVEVFERLRAFRDVNKVTGNDWVEADYHGIHFRMADSVASTQSVTTTVDKDGETLTQTSNTRRFQGRMMEFIFDRNFGEGLQVISEDFMKAVFSRESVKGGIPFGWEAVDTELYEFNKQFDAYAPTAQDGMRLLTPQIIEAISLAKLQMDLPLLFCFEGNHLFLFIDAEGDDMFDVARNAKRTSMDEIRRLHRDIGMICAFLDTMYLKGNVAHTR